MTTQRTELNCINKFHTIYWIFTRFGTRTSDSFTAILLQSVTPVISFLYVYVFRAMYLDTVFSHFHCTVDNVTAFGIYAIMRSIYSSHPWICMYARLCICGFFGYKYYKYTSHTRHENNAIIVKCRQNINYALCPMQSMDFSFTEHLLLLVVSTQWLSTWSTYCSL